ncbi:hypothetical protein CRE_17577 [Caenorhabditis remanei]|uniref:F-box domain-containing protein n=1 Tax=Caenorhabditis remanei TaxID=31234 RepID=E3NF49_CAERE|nr:hypothetical protein CRE_17577 [Caenorhabditis remanei]
MTFLFALLLCWIISVFFKAIESLLIPNIPLPPPHFPPSQTVSIRPPDVPIPSSPFPLFLVPFVPLRRIIDFMKADALVSLSFCSRKSHSVIKTQRRAPFDGRLCVSGPNRNVMFYSVKNLTRVLRAANYLHCSNSDKNNYVKMNGQYVPVEVHRYSGYLISYSDNTMNGLKAITEYVTDLFNLDVAVLKINRESFHLIEWMNSRQKTPLKKVVHLGWRSRSTEDEMYYILRHCRCSSEIRIHSEAPPNFRLSEKFRQIDCLVIWHGQWVTLDNLLTMDGINIILEKSTLTNTDLNVFLKHWLTGGCPRLKLFWANTGSVDLFQVLADLLHNTVYMENRRNYTSPFGYTLTLSDGYDIQRSDGVTATVHYHPPRTFVIAVWPETTHNFY